MLENVKRFDMDKPPKRQMLRPIMWALSFPGLISHRNKLTKIGMEGVKPPYLLLCNHNAFMDMKAAVKATFPHRTNFVVAIDGFISREWLLRRIGCICKRKFTNDLGLLWKLRKVAENGDIPVIYPEARYSLCGTTAVLPDGIGRLVRFLKLPVVTLICHGHHVNSPFFNLPDHKVKGTTATMKLLITAEEAKTLSHEELKARIEKDFVYDDYRWQEEKGVRITYPKRAEGLHKVLYQCPACRTEYRMTSSGTTLKCEACGKEWEVDELNRLKAKSGRTEFSHIPDWYEWERKNVRAEVEDESYSLSCAAQVDALPNAKGYIDIGSATLVHDMTGTRLSGTESGKPYEIFLPADTNYSVHIEYDYLGTKGDCVDLNTPDDTLYVYPVGRDFSVTKIALATEELYAFHRKRLAEEKRRRSAEKSSPAET